MAITSALCTSFKTELLKGIHDFDNDTIKLALIKGSATGTYNSTTTNYSNVTDNLDESNGTGYTAGGDPITVTTGSTGTTALVDFADKTFSNITLLTDGCIIYNASKSNRAIAVVNFSSTVDIVFGDLVINFPSSGSLTSMVRIQ